MGSERRQLWSGTSPSGNPFALPRGPFGPVAGLLMARGNRRQNAEVLAYCGVAPEDEVLEVGHGPGVLLGLLAERARAVTGVDPSPQMVRMALRRNFAAVRAGRVRVRVGSAEHTGAPDASADLVVSVNTVAMWPRLDAAVDELHRVLRPGGRLVLSWHLSPARFALAPDERAEVREALARRFGAADTGDLRHGAVFFARR
ncbi:class I SAM-dependent methyltransferase [Nocardiopsis chromatogenes]|uniref:class I SAM-dependent methyltransferase n=1 Tax=Nocardiopsis chromatogenes TaxID=280239 RepID=UPI0003492039|nr:class I SAM-dependent methyltransferase [Nocardiopsis chromatogenes]